MEQRSICIVTRGSLSCGPRVVKEADALSRAGYRVHVVAYQDAAWLVAWDAVLARERAWTFEAMRCYSGGVIPRCNWLKTGVRQHCFRQLAQRFTFAGGVAEHAFSRPYDELVARARAAPASLYIAHNAEALPAAVNAARARGALLAFDSEDLHSGEVLNNEPHSLRAALLEHVERRCLPACCYVSVPSEPIADALVERYGVRRPVAVHNAFPWADRARLDGQRKDRRSDALSLYWFSQVTGLNRGLQDCVRALGLIQGSFELHIRGNLAKPVEVELRTLAGEHGVERSLFFHPTVHPDELLSRTAEHDIGLALEPPVSENPQRTVSNKLFLYMLAGLALAATDTLGQRSILDSCPDAGFLYKPGDYHALARELQLLADSPGLLAERKRASLAAAERRWNWETEQVALLGSVERVFSGEAGASDRLQARTGRDASRSAAG